LSIILHPQMQIVDFACPISLKDYNNVHYEVRSIG